MWPDQRDWWPCSLSVQTWMVKVWADCPMFRYKDNVSVSSYRNLNSLNVSIVYSTGEWFGTQLACVVLLLWCFVNLLYQVTADFDFTLTKFKANGTRCAGTHSKYGLTPPAPPAVSNHARNVWCFTPQTNVISRKIKF